MKIGAKYYFKDRSSGVLTEITLSKNKTVIYYFDTKDGELSLSKQEFKYNERS
ncbi:MAG: hypothetical protein ACYC9R_06325 [Nitrosotalea sp.]